MREMSSAPRHEHRLRQFQRIGWPELRRHRVACRHPRQRAAARQRPAPACRNRLAAMTGPQQRPSNPGCRIGIAAAAYGVHDAFLDIGYIQELIKGILQGNHYPALVRGVIVRRGMACGFDGLHHDGMHPWFACLGEGGGVGSLGIAGGDGNGHRGGVGGAGVAACRVRMRQAALSRRAIVAARSGGQRRRCRQG